MILFLILAILLFDEEIIAWIDDTHRKVPSIVDVGTYFKEPYVIDPTNHVIPIYFEIFQGQTAGDVFDNLVLFCREHSYRHCMKALLDELGDTISNLPNNNDNKNDDNIVGSIDIQVIDVTDSGSDINYTFFVYQGESYNEIDRRIRRVCYVFMGNYASCVKTIHSTLLDDRAIQEHLIKNRDSISIEETMELPLKREFHRRYGGRAIMKMEHYFDVYERHLAKYNNENAMKSINKIKLLEFGMGHGGSVDMWKEYFKGDGNQDRLEIHHVDVNEECKNFEQIDKDSYVHIGSQDDEGLLRYIVDKYGPFDIIIDDASHRSEHMISSFKSLYTDDRAIQPNGVYIVEDTYTSYMHNNLINRTEGIDKPSYCESCDPTYSDVTFMEYAKMMVDELNAYSAEGNLIRNTKSCALKGMQYLHRRSTPITRSTVGISFYDSIVVFEKGQHRRNVPTSSGDIWGDNNNGV